MTKIQCGCTQSSFNRTEVWTLCVPLAKEEIAALQLLEFCWHKQTKIVKSKQTNKKPKILTARKFTSMSIDALDELGNAFLLLTFKPKTSFFNLIINIISSTVTWEKWTGLALVVSFRKHDYDMIRNWVARILTVFFLNIGDRWIHAHRLTHSEQQ